MDRIAQCTNEAVLPFYVLHQTVRVGIGFFVVQWAIGSVAKYMVISMASLITTLVLYDIGVRRIWLTRLLFGIRLKKKREHRGKD